MSFRATVLVGNRKGKIGLWISKGADVTIAVSKASREAYKNLKDVPLTKDNTVPYTTTTKYKAVSYTHLDVYKRQGPKLKRIRFSSRSRISHYAKYRSFVKVILNSK